DRSSPAGERGAKEGSAPGARSPRAGARRWSADPRIARRWVPYGDSRGPKEKGDSRGRSSPAQGGAAGHRWGLFLGVARDGNTSLIGSEADAAWVFTRSGGKWSQQGEKLTGGVEENGNGSFGLSTALSSDGNTALIGAPIDDFGIGAAWVFTRSGGEWSHH